MTRSVALGLTLLLAVGCAAQAPRAADPSSPATPSASDSASDGHSAAPDVPAPSAATAPESVDASQTRYFESPSRNIVCSLAAVRVVCEIAQHTFQAPPKPSSCQYDFGAMFELVADEPARPVCYSDTAFGPAHPVLTYGSSVGNGRFVCRSTESSMTCRSSAGSHGFELSRSEFRLY